MSRSLRQRVAAFVTVGALAVLTSACSIPTEDRPQPISREQTTTVAPTP